MKIILTGAAGLLGRTLAWQASRAGHQVVGMARRPVAEEIEGVSDLVFGDLADESLLRRDWNSHQGAAVCHFAANARIHDDGADYWRDNVMTTRTACALARRTGGRLIFLSSSAVYSGAATRHSGRRLTVDDETEPATEYGRSKLAAEHEVLASGVDAMILRLFSILSLRLPAIPERGHIVQALAHSLRTGAELVLRTDSRGRTAVRDYVWADDVANAVLACLGRAWCDGTRRILNLCSGEPTSIQTMAELTREISGRDFRIRLVPDTSEMNTVMVGDPGELQAAISFTPRSQVEKFCAKLTERTKPYDLSSRVAQLRDVAIPGNAL